MVTSPTIRGEQVCIRWGVHHMGNSLCENKRKGVVYIEQIFANHPALLLLVLG